MTPSAPLTCEAVVVTCIDFRFQPHFDRWLAETVGHTHYDRVSIAGGVKAWEQVFPQIALSQKLHSVRRVILINHEDCGAYGAAGTPERHASDLNYARASVLAAYPDLQVELYYVHLDGTFERVPPQ